jgi:hypothetical protein
VRFEAVAPERIDGLLGTLRTPAIPPALLAIAAAVLAAIPTLVVVQWHPQPLELLVAAVPALLLARRAAMRPA